MRWHARIGHDRIYIDVTIYDDAMWLNFAPTATEYRPKSPTAWDAADFFSPVIWSSPRGCSCDSRYCDNSDLRMDTAYTGADREMYWGYDGSMVMQYDMLKGGRWQRHEKFCIISERKAKIQRADKLNKLLISFRVPYLNTFAHLEFGIWWHFDAEFRVKAKRPFLIYMYII